MAMLTLNGKVANLYESPRGVNKTTGESYGGQNRLQLICENILQNGETKIELVDLGIDDVSPYRDSVGAVVSVPVGVYVNGGKPAFYALKGQGPSA
jgi:hypothetical protein